MIVCTSNEYPIGYRGLGVQPSRKEWHPNQPFVVIRVASPDEYLADCAQAGITPLDGAVRDTRSPRARFYEISVD